ncbi:FHA domain-containing protein [Nocardioides sp. SR21]|uniref:FHA domain-containing protein n=1 Tax=Nocardioides sp. SR21 TaxID=2919501 RepID=UPI001FA9E870|nr:FHA domain-containing protein [Nocardioides sp. SR21]
MTDDLSWSFRSGDWLGVFGANSAVVLPPSEKSQAAVLWELVDGGAGYEQILDVLLASGLRAVPDFVLVSRKGDLTRVLLRGSVSAHFATADEVVHLDGSGDLTWVERTLTGVTRMRFDVSEEPPAPDDLVVAGGLVRISSAEQPPSTVAVVVPAPAEEPEPAPVLEPDPHLEDDEDATRIGVLDPVTLGAPLPGIEGQPAAPPVTSRPVARLVVAEGETVDVDRVVLVGRAPEPRRADTAGAPHLVAVSSPHQEISSTHLEVRPGTGADHGSAVVTDLGSTNGTLLVQPGLPPEDLKAGVAVQLLPGAVLDLGDGVTIQVVNP